jgi:hypothetical protein
VESRTGKGVFHCAFCTVIWITFLYFWRPLSLMFYDSVKELHRSRHLILEHSALSVRELWLGIRPCARRGLIELSSYLVVNSLTMYVR